MTIRAIIVDDEELARRGIRSLLARESDVEVTAECSTAREAIQTIRTQAPDLMFLDIQMPEHSGFEVIESITRDYCPHVVFVTAFDDFAVRAFDVHALDYLLKPVNEQRFQVAMQRARGAMSSTRNESIARRLALLAADVGTAGLRPDPIDQPDRIPVKSGGRIVVVRMAEVDWVKAEHDYVSLHVGSKSWLVRETIGAIEARFAGCGLLRIHRSTLVNVERVKELRSLDKGEYLVILRDGVELKLSRNYRGALPRLAGTSI
jgi:two-component system, LytTR family, response regulator